MSEHLALERLQALAAGGCGWVSLLIADLEPDAALGESVADAELAQLGQVQEAWWLAARGLPGRAREALEGAGDLPPGLVQAGRELAERLSAMPSEQAGPEPGSQDLPETPMDLHAWLNRVQTWRETLGV